jgi:hypothetical protein
VDAAIAANALMGLVAPMSNGIGGDLFVIYYDAKSGKLYGLNASGWAPAGLTIDFLKNQGLRDMPQHGIQTVTVPGAVDGWQKLLDRSAKRNSPRCLHRPLRLPRTVSRSPSGLPDFGKRMPTSCGEMRPRRRPIFRITALPRSGRSSAIRIWRARCA